MVTLKDISKICVNSRNGQASIILLRKKMNIHSVTEESILNSPLKKGKVEKEKERYESFRINPNDPFQKRIKQLLELEK